MKFLWLLIVLSACTSDNQRKTENITKLQDDKYYQYNIWGAFVNKVFDGNLTVERLKSKGNMGLGSFDLLDGEMIMLNGITYRVTEDGNVSEGNNEDQIVYANAVFFDSANSFSIDSSTLNYDQLRQVLNDKLQSKNYFHAFKVHGTFKYIKCGGLTKQSSPFETGLDVLIPNRPIFEGEEVSGTLVGFYCPEFIGDINTVGYHFHFISDDRKLGGHVMEFQSLKPLKVEMKKIANYEFELPSSQTFDTVQLSKQFQYKKL